MPLFYRNRKCGNESLRRTCSKQSSQTGIALNASWDSCCSQSCYSLHGHFGDLVTKPIISTFHKYTDGNGSGLKQEIYALKYM